MGTPVIKQPVTHVIYDFDGLLVDTEPLYTLANSRCLEAHGKEFTMDIKSGESSDSRMILTCQQLMIYLIFLFE